MRDNRRIDERKSRFGVSHLLVSRLLV